jgi:bifunctional non-homologous end joining protein LigD
VSKRKSSPYRSGRFDDWRKTKCMGHEDFTVIGFTDFAGSSKSVGSLLVAQYRDGALTYAGRIGTGFDDRTRTELRQTLSKYAIPNAPVEVPRSDQKDAHWVEPEVNVRGRFLEKTSRGIIRQASYDGLIEMSQKSTSAPISTFTVTHGDRVIDEKSSTTKQDIANYYSAVLHWLYPHLEGRAVSVIRCPDGVAGECFFQRHVRNNVEGTQGVRINEDEYLTLTEPKGVLHLVQFGAIEFHPWGSRSDNPDVPDQIIFDLDPGEDVPWPSVVEAANLFRERLESIKLKCFLKLSGGKGLHVVCPIKPELEWPQVKAFTKTIAEDFTAKHPKKFVSKMTKSIRGGKIFVDYLRNDKTSTAVAAYSLRSRPGMAAAWPIRWEEAEGFGRSDAVTIINYADQLAEDPWPDFSKAGPSLRKILGV